MRYLIFIFWFAMLIPSANGQIGQWSWVKVSHQVKRLDVVNASITNALDSIICHTGATEFTQKHEKFRYFHLYVSQDSICQLNFRLSKVPLKNNKLIGYYAMGIYTVFVYNRLPDYLKINPSAPMSSFRYMGRKSGSYTYIDEDDIPYWLFCYDKNGVRLESFAF